VKSIAKEKGIEMPDFVKQIMEDISKNAERYGNLI
jgi:hypothetical protein